MGQTKISWADAVWNPITGCERISDGCKHCYAMRMSGRLAGRAGYAKNDPFKVTLHADKLDEPLKWKTGRRIFVCSMGDLFHEDVRPGWLDEVYAVMREATQHQFLILTKRPFWMRNWFGLAGPLPNVWVGVSVENQKTADERIPILLQTPAAGRFVSCEPLLGPVKLTSIKWGKIDIDPMNYFERGVPPPNELWSCNNALVSRQADKYNPEKIGLDWVIAGGESGPGARPMRLDWIRSIRDQCEEAGVDFHFKQWGEWIPASQISDAMAATIDWRYTNQCETDLDNEVYWQVGKKRAGNLLDGVHHGADLSLPILERG